MINDTCLTVFDRIKTFKELYFVKRNNCPIFPSALSVFPDSRPNFHVRPYVTLSANQTHLNTLTNGQSDYRRIPQDTTGYRRIPQDTAGTLNTIF